MTGLFDTINNSSYDFYFLVVDEFLNISLPEFTHFYSVTPAKLNITLDQKNSGRLLSHPTTLDFIKTTSSPTSRQPVIIPFKPSAKIDLICQKNHWIMAGNPAPLNRLLEDKIKFPEILEKYHLPQIPYLILPFSADSFTQAQKRFGPNLVLQTHFGWAGNSSLLTSSFPKASSKYTTGTPVKFTPYLPGYSLINNCCLTGIGLIQSPPGLQYTGLKPLTQNPLATVGRQWPCQAPPEVISQIKKITIDFSKILIDLNYRGFFGLDFLVSDNQIYLLECNPRLTASFAFYTDIEINAGITPLFFHHLSEFCRLEHGDPELSRFSDPKIIGSEITAKNSSGATVKKYHDFSAFSDSANPVSIDPQILSKVL